MPARAVALTICVCYLALGLLGLLPPLYEDWPSDAPALLLENAYGLFLGWWPSNLALRVVYLAIGAWGLAAWRRPAAAGRFCRGVVLLTGAMALLGLLPASSTVFGLLPLFGANVWLHGLTAFVAAVGWAAAAARRPADVAPGAGRAAEAATPMAVAGYPLHRLLVSFPIAALTGVFVTDFALWWTRLPWYNGSQTFWPEASLWLLKAGLATGALAAVLALRDLVAIRPRASRRAAGIHAVGATAVLVAALANLALRLPDPAARVLPVGLVLSGLTLALLIAVGWHGGVVVARDVPVGHAARAAARRETEQPPATGGETHDGRQAAVEAAPEDPEVRHASSGVGARSRNSSA